MSFAAASLAVVVVGLVKLQEMTLSRGKRYGGQGRALTSCASSISAMLALPDAAIAPAATAAAVLLPVALGPFGGLRKTQNSKTSNASRQKMKPNRYSVLEAYLNLTFFCLLALDRGAVFGTTGVAGPSEADKLPSHPSLARATIALAFIFAAL